MLCPRCKRDLKDVPEGRPRGHFYRSDDHFGLEFRRFGMQCTNCGFVSEMITKATGRPYHKRDTGRDLRTIDMFEDVERINA